jgi:hypothetical protein
MYNELFESVIRTSGENTDDIDDFDDRDNFWAPVPEIEQIFEQVLREMADTTPFNMARIIRTVFIENWDLRINEEFAETIVNMSIQEIKYDGTFGLLTNDGKKINIKTKTNEDKNNALNEIKKFVDTVLKICEDLINKKKESNKYYEQFADYFKDKKRITQIYTKLAIRIASEYSIPTTIENWIPSGYQPF